MCFRSYFMQPPLLLHFFFCKSSFCNEVFHGPCSSASFRRVFFVLFLQYSCHGFFSLFNSLVFFNDVLKGTNIRNVVWAIIVPFFQLLPPGFSLCSRSGLDFFRRFESYWYSGEWCKAGFLNLIPGHLKCVFAVQIGHWRKNREKRRRNEEKGRIKLGREQRNREATQIHAQVKKRLVATWLQETSFLLYPSLLSLQSVLVGTKYHSAVSHVLSFKIFAFSKSIHLFIKS